MRRFNFKHMVIKEEILELIYKFFKKFKVLVIFSYEGFSIEGLATVAANNTFNSLFAIFGTVFSLFSTGEKMREGGN